MHRLDKPEKIKSGRFKGKYLMLPGDVRMLEHCELNEPVEVLLARVCEKVESEPLSIGSPLAENTIRRLDEELDPICVCEYKTSLGYHAHHVSGHDSVLKDFREHMEAKRKKNYYQELDKVLRAYIYD